MSHSRIALIVLLVIVGATSPAAAVGTGLGADGFAAEDCTYPVTATDATGTEVTLEEEPETVVTLNPSAAQTMWEIGAEEKVIGLTEHAQNLEGAEDRTNVSTSEETVEPEIVVDLEPDLVLAPSSQVVSEDLVEILRDAGLTVYLHPSAESIDDVREKTRLTGEFVGECEGAAETVDWMDHEIGVVESAVEGEERPDVLYTFFGYTAGEDTFIHEILETSGGTNLAAEAGISEYQQLSEETVVDADPDWIVLNSNSPDLPEGEAYEATTAVERDQVIVVNINHLNRAGPRITHAITELAAAFHPETYADARAAADVDAADDGDDEANISADDNSTDGSEDAADGTDDSTNATESASANGEDGTPGFGALVALTALALAALATIRYRDGGS